MNLKLNTLIVLFIFFASPFVYFYLNATQIHSQFLINPEVIYPLFFLLAMLFSFYFANNLRRELKTDSTRSLLKVCIAGVILYAFYLLCITWYRYANFTSEAIDVSFFHQVIWQLSQFKLPYIWSLDQPVFPVWAQHFSPILFFLAPIYWFTHDATALVLTQALAAISAIIPIYYISKRYLHARSIAVAISFAYLAFGGMEFGFEYGFHEILFFPVLFLWSYYFYLCKNTKLYLIFITLSLFVKEEVAFIVFFWGLYLLIIKRDKVMGSITSIFGILWYIICFNIVFPYFNRGNDFIYWGQYQVNGSSGLLGIIKYTLFKPFQFLATLVTPELKIQMMLETFGQFAFLLFLFPPAVIIIFPSLMEKLLSSGVAMGNGAHYSSAIAAVTVVATIEAIPYIYKNKLINRFIPDKNVFFSTLIFYMALSSNIFFGFPAYSIVPYHKGYYLEQEITDGNRQLINQIISRIPQNATISSQYQITPHFNKYYKYTTTWPGMSGKEDFIIIDTQMVPLLGATSKEYNDDIDKLNANKNYQLVLGNLGILVYKNKAYSLPGNPQ